MLRRREMVWALVLSSLVMVSSSRGDDPTPAEDEPHIAGLWKASFETPQGTVHHVKEHADGKTTVSVYDAEGALIAQKQSRYELSRSGETRVFTYFDNVATAGPAIGQRDPRRRSYLYRVRDNRFYEVHGMLLDDEGPVVVRVWQRMDEPPATP